MSKKISYSEIIILDLESTCWETGNTNPPNGQRQEIIEIGIAILNTQSLRITDEVSIVIKPEHSTISQYCTNLTSLTQADVDEGISLEEASALMMDEFKTHKRPWGSWGAWDRDMLHRDCELKDVIFPLTNRHINIKALFPIVFNLSKDCGLDKACELLKLPFEGRHHRGIDDAKMTAKIFAECLRGGVLP